MMKYKHPSFHYLFYFPVENFKYVIFNSRSIEKRPISLDPVETNAIRSVQRRPSIEISNICSQTLPSTLKCISHYT